MRAAARELRMRNCELRVGAGVILGVVVKRTQMDADGSTDYTDFH